MSTKVNYVCILLLIAMANKLCISALPQRSNGREVELKLDTDASCKKDLLNRMSMQSNIIRLLQFNFEIYLILLSNI